MTSEVDTDNVSATQSIVSSEGYNSSDENNRNKHEEYTEAYTSAMPDGENIPINAGGVVKERKALRRTRKKKQNPSNAEGQRKQPSAKKTKRENPLMKTKYNLSKPLQDVLRDTEFKNLSSLSRPEVVKGLWEHIRKNDLQTVVKGKRDHIRVDGPLRRVFEDTENIQMFAMNKQLSKHLSKV